MEITEKGIRKDLQKILKDDKRKLDTILARLEDAPTGTMRKRISHGYDMFYVLTHTDEGKKHEVVLGKRNPEMFQKYAYKRYYDQLSKVISNEIKVIETFLSKYAPEQKYDAYSDLEKKVSAVIKPVFPSDQSLIAKWETSEFRHNEYPIDNNQYVTAKGEVVRSRIELIVANQLFSLDIPYRYECELKIQDKRLFPDFTVLHPKSLDFYYIEIFGMMDEERYAAKAYKKINEYGKAGLLPRLLPLFDSVLEPIATPTLEQIFTNTFLR